MGGFAAEEEGALPVTRAYASRTRGFARALGASGAWSKMSWSSDVRSPLQSGRSVRLREGWRGMRTSGTSTQMLASLAILFGVGLVSLETIRSDIPTFEEDEQLIDISWKAQAVGRRILTMCLQWFPFVASGPRGVRSAGE